jgi:hypothetical protein
MDLEECEREIDRVGDLVDVTEAELNALRQLLKPYYFERDDIYHSVKRTHDRRSDGAVLFRPEGAADRVPLFTALDNLNAAWLEPRRDWTAVKARRSNYERALKKLKTELKHLKRKEGKNGKDQGNLFH